MLESLSSIVGILGWILTGAWMLRNWYIRREDHPRIGMTAEVVKLYRSQHFQVVEVSATAANTGDVRHVFKDIRYTLRGTNLKNPTPNPNLMGQLDLPIVIGKDVSFFPLSWQYSFVDAGQTSTYKTLLVVPIDVKILKLSVKMQYADPDSDFHSAAWYGYIG